MSNDVKVEVARLFGEGKTPSQVKLELESRGFSTDAIANAIAENSPADNRTAEETRNARLLSVREVFDRVGYGGATPPFVNILFWLSQMTQPYILAVIAVLNGLKTLLSVVWSSILQEYGKIHRVSKNTIATTGIVFGFSFLFMAFGLMLQSMLLFSVAFLVGTIGIVAYGDLYQRFVHDSLRKERMGAFLRSIAHWGVVITAVTLLFAGYLMDAFPMTGTPWSFVLFGMAFNLHVYGYLLAFEITAFAFIIAGYVSSLVVDKREDRKYPFVLFLGEYYQIVKNKLYVFKNKYVMLLAMASIVSGFLQIIMTSYSGIAIYQIFKAQYGTPFFTLAIVYAIAVIASFTGPFFTGRIHRSTGLAPTLVFGTLLSAILPLVLVYNPNIITITAALCLQVIGGAIIGFGQGLLAQKLMDDETRRSYFQAQSFIIILPYLILIPLTAIAATVWPLTSLFLIVAACLIAVVMPIYFLLVTISQKLRL